jgi:hypothetical protein
MYEQDAPVGSRGVAVPVRRGRVGGLIGSAARRPDWQQKLSVVVHRARDRMQMVYRTSLTNSILSTILYQWSFLTCRMVYYVAPCK